MKIKIISGFHLTNLDKQAIQVAINSNEQYVSTPRKKFEVIKTDKETEKKRMENSFLFKEDVEKLKDIPEDIQLYYVQIEYENRYSLYTIYIQ